LLEELREAALEVEVSASELAACLRARLAKQIEARLLAEHDLGRTESFDGLLLGLCRALRDPERGAALARAIRTRFPAIMIDEFQDTDRIQYEIFRRVFGQPGERAVLYLIGDPKQSIYRFRGADVQTYLGAAREASESVWTLGTS